jgi:hypothetical protein
MRADREVDAPSGLKQFFRDLGPRGTGSHDQDRSFGKLGRIAVTRGVHLHHSGLPGNQLRNNGALEGAGCRDDAVGLDHTCGGFDTEARATDPSCDLQDVDTATDGGRDLPGIGDEIIRHCFLGREIVRTDSPVDIGKCQTWKAIVPGRAVRDQ